jgi:hypothetical protein
MNRANIGIYVELLKILNYKMEDGSPYTGPKLHMSLSGNVYKTWSISNYKQSVLDTFLNQCTEKNKDVKDVEHEIAAVDWRDVKSYIDAGLKTIEVFEKDKAVVDYISSTVSSLEAKSFTFVEAVTNPDMLNIAQDLIKYGFRDVRFLIDLYTKEAKVYLATLKTLTFISIESLKGYKEA